MSVPETNWFENEGTATTPSSSEKEHPHLRNQQLLRSNATYSRMSAITHAASDKHVTTVTLITM